MRPIELLAPARNLETGRQAILHGADAVYIGGPAFGARQAAGNSLEDIAALCEFARPIGVKVYVTLNTIIYDHELREVENLTHSLYSCGVSALIVQDLALLRLDCPLPLHASTQMDNRSPEKAQLLQALGYEQIVLARELSLEQIRKIHAAVPHTPLEAFVHGALCVSYSGRCQASQYCFARSANRGECAQFCRLPFDLETAEGTTLKRGLHLLSLRDMNRTASLEDMIDAGVSSFKIEGRLKDVAYVKNVTAWYRQRLDEIISKRPDLCRASSGEHTFGFTPSPERSFNRGFTEYFLHGRKGDEASVRTPKSVGQPIGTLRGTGPDYIDLNLMPGITLANGDGLCYFTAEGRLAGFRINRAEGSRAFVAPGTNLDALQQSLWASAKAEGGDKRIYRNQDMAFDAALSRPTAERRLPLDIVLTDALLTQTYDLARSSQEENVRKQMSRLGDTPFTLRSLSIEFSQNWFIPSSHLAEMRRRIVAEALEAQEPAATGQPKERLSIEQLRTIGASLSTTATAIEMGGGVANHLAEEVADALGLEMPSACEVNADFSAASGRSGMAAAQPEVLMTTRYCLRHALGCCLKEAQGGSMVKPTDKLCLVSADGRKFTLKFDCQRCEMQVLSSPRS